MFKNTFYYVVPKAYLTEKICVGGKSGTIYSPSAAHFLHEIEKRNDSRNPYKWLYEPHVVSKIVHDRFFFQLLEIFHTMNLKLDFPSKISILTLGENIESTQDAIRYYRGFVTDYWSAQEMDLITIEYNEMEPNLSLLFSALRVQKRKGVLLLRVNSLFTELSMDILYLLASSYEKVAIMKPSCSDATSNEKYIICKGFIANERIFPVVDAPERILPIEIPLQFYGKVEEINYIMSRIQLDAIHSILVNDANPKPKQELCTCIEWCIRYQVPYYD